MRDDVDGADEQAQSRTQDGGWTALMAEADRQLVATDRVERFAAHERLRQAAKVSGRGRSDPEG